MRTLAIATLTLSLLTTAAIGQDKGKGAPKGPPVPGLTLTTSAYEDGGIIPNKYTQATPDAVSPKLDWDHVPAGTVTFALLLHDPDVAIGKKLEDVTHWMAFNIPGTSTGLPEGVPATATMPDGTVQIKNRGNRIGYMGPGAGAAGPYHHYTFELFALDTKLDLKEDATREDILKAMDGHILGKGILVGRFHR
jgi:Raf kinase inhibitor-like YbhB/YbcL family protein